MSRAAAWIPGLAAIRAGRTGAGAVTGLLWLSQVLLWIGSGPRMARALFAPSAPALTLAAWCSLVVLAGTWICGRRLARPARTHPAGPWAASWRRLVSRRQDALALLGCSALLLIALEAPALVPHDPHRIGDGVASHHLPPSSRLHLVHTRDGSVMAANEVELEGDRVRLRRRDAWTSIPRGDLRGSRPRDWHETRFHLLGTDHLGRDLFSRILAGSRVSLGIGLLAALLAAALGASIGAIAGWSGPRVDALLMRLTDAALSFPRLFLVLLVLTVIPGSFTAVVVVLAATGWMAPCRLVRAQVLSLRERDFVQAARTIGRGGAGIIWRHLLPNAIAPLLVAVTLRIGDTMLIEAGLSFLGLGVPPPHPTWGNIISGGRPALVEAWWVATFPGLTLVAAVILFNLLSDGVRSALASR